MKEKSFLPWLQLDLSDNRIESLGEASLVGLQRIRIVRLNNNVIKTVRFEPTSSVVEQSTRYPKFKGSKLAVDNTGRDVIS